MACYSLVKSKISTSQVETSCSKIKPTASPAPIVYKPSKTELSQRSLLTSFIVFDQKLIVPTTFYTNWDTRIQCVPRGVLSK